MLYTLMGNRQHITAPSHVGSLHDMAYKWTVVSDMQRVSVLVAIEVFWHFRKFPLLYKSFSTFNTCKNTL